MKNNDHILINIILGTSLYKPGGGRPRFRVEENVKCSS